MIQVQNGRLHYNWLRRGTEYPRYEVLRPEFDQLLNRFRLFVKKQGVPELALDQWEVTYVNRIPRGELWQGPLDWTRVFRLTPAVQVADPLELETQTGSWHFEIKPKRGRLHVELKHGIPMKSGADRLGAELLVLTLTARGPVSVDSASGLSWEQGLDCGRECIVRSFYDLTTNYAHEMWGLVR